MWLEFDRSSDQQTSRSNDQAEEINVGRLPLQFAGKDVTFRIPYNIAAELDVGPNLSGIVFPEASNF